MFKNPKIYALYGNVSSGKSTLANRLSKHYGDIPHLSSDAIREEINGDIGGHSGNVFETMRDRMNGHLAAGNSVVIDSTGMSPKYRKLVEDYRSRVPMHLIQLYTNPETWKQREQGRSDRWKLDENRQKVPFEMPERAYQDSSKINLKPDLFIDTSEMHPDDVFKKVLKHIEGGEN